MDHAAVAQGFSDLDALSLSEYKQPLLDIVERADPLRTYQRVGRLAGLHLKLPFVHSRPLATPSAATGAHYGYDLVDKPEFEASGAPEKAALDELRNGLSPSNPRYGSMTTYDMIVDARYERGVFSLLAFALAPSICSDAVMRAQVQAAFKNQEDARDVARLLTRQIALLERAGGLVTAAVATILVAIGPQEFCELAEVGVTVPEEE